jgi:hypothetical protein
MDNLTDSVSNLNFLEPRGVRSFLFGLAYDPI